MKEIQVIIMIQITLGENSLCSVSVSKSLKLIVMRIGSGERSGVRFCLMKKEKRTFYEIFTTQCSDSGEMFYDYFVVSNLIYVDLYPIKGRKEKKRFPLCPNGLLLIDILNVSQLFVT